jgi:hypothetical protein
MQGFINKKQIVPIALALLSAAFLTGALFSILLFINHITSPNVIVLRIRITDVFVGLTIYMKTAIDFALFLGNLMYRHRGVKNRVAIEMGTAIGNGIGTIGILCIWLIFKTIPFFLFIMMIIASVVLLHMAEDGLSEYLLTHSSHILHMIFSCLNRINHIFSRMTRCATYKQSTKQLKQSTWLSLFLFSCTIPLLLGMDDFAGYIPLFSVINIFGFAVGVFIGHLLLTISLFAFPKGAIRVIRTPFVLLAGSFVFIYLAFLGVYEAFHILFQLLLH